jgi:hypothetical protein
MKKVLGFLALAVLMGVGAALAQTGGFGAIQTSPVIVPGFIDFNAGPQASAIRATGGTFTCTSAGTIVVPAAAVTTNSVVITSLKSATSAATAAVYMSALTVGTGFTVKCSTSDVSVYNYWVLG